MVIGKEVAGALIAAVASLVVAVFSAIVSFASSRRSQYAAAKLELAKARLVGDVEYLKHKLDEQAAERDARRDYEYDARKRLYSDVEPLLFQLHESLEEAHYRVRSLARTARSGNLGDGDTSWVDGPGYYLHSTIYKLVLPAAHLRLMQRRVTFVDLGLDESIRLRYQLLKLYSRSFTDDFVMASISPKLRYDPNNDNWRAMRVKEPAVYMPQALVLGDLEKVADALILQQSETPARAASFGEFDQLIENKGHADESVQALMSLFTGFSPEARPVLARILVAQACMAQLILSTYDQKTKPEQLGDRLNRIASTLEASKVLAWKDNQRSEDLLVAQQYWAERLRWVGSSTTWLETDKSA